MASPPAAPAGLPSVAMRRIISTKRPDNGRLDQSELAVTWNSTIWPSPRLVAVTNGVPSLSRARTETAGDSLAGSASTWRLIVTSGGIGRPSNRLPPSKAASACGVDHDSAPPSVRPPSRSGTGNRSSPPFSSRGPAKRTSTPPRSTNVSIRSRTFPDRVPMSASTNTVAWAFSASSIACWRLAARGVTSSA